MAKKKNGAKYLLPTQIVAGVLASLPKNLLSGKRRDYHPVFYKMWKRRMCVLDDFRFNVKGTFPYSETLESAISNLVDSKVIWYTGSDLDKIEISDGLKRYFKDFVEPTLSKKQNKELRQIAKALAKFCI